MVVVSAVDREYVVVGVTEELVKVLVDKVDTSCEN